MFRSRKTKTEYITGQESAKDWRDAGAEVERLGERLDAVREQVSSLKEGTWAHTHWSQIESILLRKWQLSVTMQRVGLKQVGPERLYNIDYDWYEGSDEIGMRLPVVDNMMMWASEKVGFSGRSLDWSWEKARDEKLQKARQGQA